MVIKGFHLVFPGLSDPAAAVIASNVFFLFAMISVLFLGARIWNEQKSDFLGFPKTAWIFALLLEVYPHSHFWSQGYSESLFAFLFAMGLLFAIRGRLVFGALFFGLLCVTRPPGVWLGGLYCAWVLFQSLRESKELRRRLLRCLALGGLTLLPFGVFLYWQWSKTGDPIHFYHLQKNWGRAFSFLGGVLEHRPRWDRSTLFLYLSWWGGVSFLLRKDTFSRFLGASTILLGVLPVFVGGFYSYVRFISVNLGLFIWLSEWLATRPKTLLLVVTVFAVELVIQTYSYSFGLWAG
jgi:hypothetical protein